MKLLDVEWTSVLGELPRWWALRLPARRALLDGLKTHGFVPGQRFGKQLEAVIASGIAEFDPVRNRLWVGDAQRELVKVFRAMDRHRVFDAPGRATLVKYLEDHFTNTEIEVLGAGVHGGRYGHMSRHTLAPRIAFAGWAGDLLDARDDPALVAWGDARGWVAAESATTGRSIRVLGDLQRFARRLIDFPDGVPIREQLALLGDEDVAAFADALHAGLATAVVFVGLRSDDLEPMVGLWPDAVRELTRPPAKQPSAAVPVEQFTLAVNMEDMTTLLATIAAAPVRLRADDGAVFANARKVIEGRLAVLPHWAAHLFESDRVTRVDGAARDLDFHGLVQVRSQSGNPHLHATSGGGPWLALTPRERLASLIDPLRRSTDQNPGTQYDVIHAESFFPFVFPWFKTPKSLRLRESLIDAFLGAARGFIPIEDFLDHAAREANPFLALPQSGTRDFHFPMYIAGYEDPRETLRNLWRNMLEQFLIVRLIGLGGASIGRLVNGSLGFELTDAGRYLLGAADAFEYGSSNVADVVVQPNFDIVFLGAAPATEAVVARFSQRVGSAPGLAFRITRASVLGAAEAGATADEIVGALRRASSKPIPKNVEREIAGWVDAVRRGRLRVLEVIECADEETADRVGALLGGGTKAQRLTPKIFELPAGTASARLAVIKRLRAGGVFLENTTSAMDARPARRRHRRDEWEDEEL